MSDSPNPPAPPRGPDPARAGAFILAAILPPANIERLIVMLREELFRRHGLVSALALPPLIPLGFLAGGRPPALSPAAARQLGRAFPVELTVYTVEKGCLVLGVETAGALAGLREALGRLLPPAPGFLPPLDGFFLALPEGAPDPPALLAGLPAPAIRRFSAFTVGFLAVRLPEGRSPFWWRELRWEVLHRLPARRGPGAPAS